MNRDQIIEGLYLLDDAITEFAEFDEITKDGKQFIDIHELICGVIDAIVELSHDRGYPIQSSDCYANNTIREENNQ